MVLRTIQLDPGGTHRNLLAWIALETGEFDAAIEICEQIAGEQPESIEGRLNLGMFYLAAGRTADALKAADAPVVGASDNARFDHALLNALLGRPEAAREVAGRVERGEMATYTSDTFLAMLYSALGEKAKALDLLEREYREGDRVLWLWYRGIFFNPIHDDPRFVALLRTYGLPVVPLRGSKPPDR